MTDVRGFCGIGGDIGSMMDMLVPRPAETVTDPERCYRGNDKGEFHKASIRGFEGSGASW